MTFCPIALAFNCQEKKSPHQWLSHPILESFFRSHEITNSFETTLSLTAEPLSVFRIQPATRTAHNIPAHGDAILSAQFSPETSPRLATGGGDKTARIIDTDTGTPKYILQGHTHWVLTVSWSPDGKVSPIYLCAQMKQRLIQFFQRPCHWIHGR